MIHRMYVLSFLVVLGLAALASAQTFTTLYSFTGEPDGAMPVAGVIQDSDGALYGTTNAGGIYENGVVFKLNSNGTETVLHRFDLSDGSWPQAPVIRDKAGNIYGTTDSGGSNEISGTVFKIDTAGNETVLHSFAGGPSDGCHPDQGLVMDNAGNLYGTTWTCGPSYDGTIFKIDNAGNYTVLHNFIGSDGCCPAAGHLTMDNSGNLYGVTTGGNTSNGTLYKLTKNGRLTVLHSFGGGAKDGCHPGGTVVQDKAGNLYGTTYGCGSMNYGTIWRVSKTGKETILHNFAGGTSDGCYAGIGVAMDSKGNLYGVADRCGASNYGVLYELCAKGKFTVLHSFGGDDGIIPYGEVLRTAKGTLFGTTYLGPHNDSTWGYGTVWSYVP